MKKFKEKAIVGLAAIQGGVGEVQNDWKITGRVGRDDWNCWEVKVDFKKKIS